MYPKLWSKNLVLIMVINLCGFINHMMLLAAFPFFVESLGGSEAVAGTIAALFSVVAVVCRPLIGRFLDSRWRRVVLCAGIVGMAVVPACFIMVSALLVVSLLRMLYGAFMACSTTAAATVATDLIPKERFAEGMGLFGVGVALATATAPALALALRERFGFTVLFAVNAAVMVLGLILFLLLKAPQPQNKPQPLKLRSLLEGTALPASVIMLSFLLAMGAVENFVAKYAADTGLAGGGLYFLFVALSLLLTRVTTGKLVDKTGERPFVLTCNLSLIISCMLLASHPPLPLFLLSACFTGYALGGIEPALRTMAMRITPLERRGAANSTFLCAYDIGMGGGAFLAGIIISSIGYQMTYAVLPVANLVSVFLYFLWGKKHPSAFLNSQKIQQG